MATFRYFFDSDHAYYQLKLTKSTTGVLFKHSVYIFYYSSNRRMTLFNDETSCRIRNLIYINIYYPSPKFRQFILKISYVTVKFSNYYLGGLCFFRMTKNREIRII